MVPFLKQARAWAVLLLVAFCGFAVGACGGGNGGVGSLTNVTRTRTVPTQTVTTTTPGETTTQTVPAPVVTTASEPSSSSTPWGWIVLGVALVLALLVGLVVWRRHRAGAAAWGRQTADFNRRCLMALDDVLAKGSIVTGHVEAFAAEARSLEARAPDDPSRAAAAAVRAPLDELATTLESDRALRLSTPPPTSEQLDYSTALIRQQVQQLQAILRPPQAGQASGWPSP